MDALLNENFNTDGKWMYRNVCMCHVPKATSSQQCKERTYYRDILWTLKNGNYDENVYLELQKSVCEKWY